jgi:hypothetical protein
MAIFVRKNILYFIGAFVGGVGGFLYWKYVVCITGTCRITSSPINSTIYFSMMGSLFFALFQKKSQ